MAHVLACGVGHEPCMLLRAQLLCHAPDLTHSSTRLYGTRLLPACSHNATAAAHEPMSCPHRQTAADGRGSLLHTYDAGTPVHMQPLT